MNSRHKKTGDERPGDNSHVCWPLIETEKQLRQVTEENGLLIGWVAMELTSTPAIHAMTRRTRSRRREPLARPDDAATSVQVGATHTALSLTPAEPTAAHLLTSSTPYNLERATPQSDSTMAAAPLQLTADSATHV